MILSAGAYTGFYLQARIQDFIRRRVYRILSAGAYTGFYPQARIQDFIRRRVYRILSAGAYTGFKPQARIQDFSQANLLAAFARNVKTCLSLVHRPLYSPLTLLSYVISP